MTGGRGTFRNSNYRFVTFRMSQTCEISFICLSDLNFDPKRRTIIRYIREQSSQKIFWTKNNKSQKNWEYYTKTFKICTFRLNKQLFSLRTYLWMLSNFCTWLGFNCFSYYLLSNFWMTAGINQSFSSFTMLQFIIYWYWSVQIFPKSRNNIIILVP
jgi:hypothetical protein